MCLRYAQNFNCTILLLSPINMMFHTFCSFDQCHFQVVNGSRIIHLQKAQYSRAHFWAVSSKIELICPKTFRSFWLGVWGDTKFWLINVSLIICTWKIMTNVFEGECWCNSCVTSSKNLTVSKIYRISIWKKSIFEVCIFAYFKSNIWWIQRQL